MESKDKLIETDIKNRMCYYFDDITRFWDRDIDFSDILYDKKLYKENNENILIYDISYKTSMGIWYDKIDGFIKTHNKIRYLVWFDERCDKICDGINYLTSKKSGITDSINHNCAMIRIDSYDSLPFENILTFHVITLIKSVVNKDENNCYYIFWKRFP